MLESKLYRQHPEPQARSYGHLRYQSRLSTPYPPYNDSHKLKSRYLIKNPLDREYKQSIRSLKHQHAPRPPPPPKHNTLQHRLSDPTNPHPPTPRLQKSHLLPFFFFFSLNLNLNHRKITARPNDNNLHAQPRLHNRPPRPPTIKHLLTLRPHPKSRIIITAILGADKTSPRSDHTLQKRRRRRNRRGEESGISSHPPRRTDYIPRSGAISRIHNP